MQLSSQRDECILESRSFIDVDRTGLFQPRDRCECRARANQRLIAATQQPEKLQRLFKIEQAAWAELNIGLIGG